MNISFITGIEQLMIEAKSNCNQNLPRDKKDELQIIVGKNHSSIINTPVPA